MDPFKQMSEWKKNMDTFFGENFWNEFEHVLKPQIPQMNIYQTENEITCIINIPGLTDLNQINIYVNYATLELSGVIDVQHSGGTVVQEEILQGAFDRSINLPFPVRSDKVKASYKNGIVVLQLYRLISKESNKHRVPVRLLEDE